MYNKEKKKDFKTTMNFKNIMSKNDAFNIIETLFDKDIRKNGDNAFYDGIVKAYYSNKIIINNGYLVS